ncbi:MAG: transcription-repair coupling factor [Oscillospiraceae bacterium]|nr:transcription-repair coupling factor [Oscillospiraceae bacterium]
MRFFIDACESLPAVRELRRLIGKKVSPLSLVGVSQIHKGQILLTLSQDAPQLAIVPDDAAARQLCEDINFMAGTRTAYPYPAKELNFLASAGMSREYEQLRISALSALLSGECRVIAASAEAAMQFTLPESVLRERTVVLKAGESYDRDQLADALTALGYLRCEQVDAPSQFSVRGSIVDIFSPQYLMPVRIEFWGDEIDSMSWFEPETQRRTDQITEYSAAPAVEALPDAAVLADRLDALSKNLRGKHAAKLKDSLAADADKLRSGLTLPNIDLYFPLLYDQPATVFDYCGGVCAICETPAVLDALRGLTDRTREDIKLLLEDGVLCRQLSEYCLDGTAVLRKAKECTLYCLNAFLASTSTFDFQKTLSVEAAQNAPWGGSTRILADDLAELIKRGFRVMVCGGTEKTLPILMNDLQSGGIPCAIADADSECEAGRVLLTVSGLSGGFEYPAVRFACIAQSKTQSTVLRKRRFKKGQEIRALSEIAEGDLVVHAAHGIGRFMGIRKMELEGVAKDYITIQYAGTDELYVPVTQLDLVSRYIGGKEDAGVKLSKLGSPEWQKTRANVKKSVRDMAAQLIRLYAAREKASGFSFEQDDEYQREFEARFPYVETADQLRSTAEIKADMERGRPMDRLLCGDVGFGKTEVAFRAAYKCILSGKQCVLLAPTTVLAHQHYETALRRFESAPVNIELLSRFRSKKQQTEILKKTANGTVDLLIGTHRLLSKDVKFGSLGLAIIDEEQRFGVAHKERFKEMFHGIDMLTLSATPIPRTLNMALSGIRDMSVIEEPPQDRYPVQSFVLEYNAGLIVQAITRELKRGGQVYYIHNRVETMVQCAARLQEMLPDARIRYAHGKMNEQEISEIWRQLVEHEIDILVCTTIIETGVDVPNVNTLIVEQADRFGLAQLYQLRGRVGRSNRRAYAYFTYHPMRSLSEIAEKRLAAMREFTQFGSGFRIAMRDLEIRGAGSILGGQQHGQMEQVGYEMYLRMLNEAIAEEKGETPKTPAACAIDIQVEAHIPEKYISSMTSRLEVYRRIALVQTPEDKTDMIDELIDRFGEPPVSLVNLIDVSMLRNTAARLGIPEISQKRGALFFTVTRPNPKQLSAMMRKYFDRISFNDRQAPYYVAVRLIKGELAVDLMRNVLRIFSENDTNESAQ